MGNGPYFIVVEGLDGSGKTTQIEHLRDYFQARGEACYLTAEPTDLPTGKFIRRVLRGQEHVDPRTLAALFAADRVEHLFHATEGILTKLAAGYHVISSRYYFSSLAYQSEYVDPAWVANLNRLAKATLPADLTLFLDLDPAVSMQRITGRGEGSELYETLEKLRQVREDFHRAFAVYGQGERIVVVDAGDAEGRVAERIVAEIQKL
ncbi:dTMP kinase [Neolewinella sp.]|uniref:dTMP kinase n=1 Tax=Neolewinella sp. TaxID=2993543 RepID=UPI003B5255A0